MGLGCCVFDLGSGIGGGDQSILLFIDKRRIPPSSSWLWQNFSVRICSERGLLRYV